MAGRSLGDDKQILTGNSWETNTRSRSHSPVSHLMGSRIHDEGKQVGAVERGDALKCTLSLIYIHTQIFTHSWISAIVRKCTMCVAIEWEISVKIISSGTMLPRLHLIWDPKPHWKRMCHFVCQCMNNFVVYHRTSPLKCGGVQVAVAVTGVDFDVTSCWTSFMNDSGAQLM